MVRSRCGTSAVEAGAGKSPSAYPSAQVLARRSFGTCFGREQVPCLLLDQRSHLTEPEVAAPALIVARRRERYAVRARAAVVCGPVAREVRRAGPVSGRPWPRGAKRTAAYAQLLVVGGPAARNDSASRQSRVHLWPGGASRTGDRRSHHPNPHFAPAGGTAHQARLVRRRRNWCEVEVGTPSHGWSCPAGLRQNSGRPACVRVAASIRSRGTRRSPHR